MSLPSLQGKLSLVTGASSGLGVDFARQLAAAGSDLVLVARREELLTALRDELTQRHGVAVQVIAMDLSAPHAAECLHGQLASQGRPVDVLINNAGYGLYGEFVELDWARERNMLELDILTLVHLSKLFGRDMARRRSGHILQIASIGAYQATPTYASYAAAKSFVLHFGEALHEELKPHGVVCTVLSPGVTATEFLKVSGQAITPYQKMAMMESPDVARIGLEALFRGRASIVPGFFNALAAWSNRLMPRRLSAQLAHRVMT